MFGIASRDNVLPFSFVFALWVPYVAQKQCLYVVFFSFLSHRLTDFCSCSTILFIRLVCHIDSFFWYIFDYLFETFLMFFSHVQIPYFCTRMTTEHVRGISGQRNLCSYPKTERIFLSASFLTSYFSCVLQSRIQTCIQKVSSGIPKTMALVKLKRRSYNEKKKQGRKQAATRGR